MGKWFRLTGSVDIKLGSYTLELILSNDEFHERTEKQMLKVGTVHAARFVFISDDQLAVITTYDNSFNDYIREFVDIMGDTFNALLEHIEDTDEILPLTQDNVSAFQQWVGKRDRSYDIATDTVDYQFIAYPTYSALEIRRTLGI